MKLLLVEDSITMRGALERQLRGHIEYLVMAGSAEQALHLLDMLGGEGAFDAVLSDYDLGTGKTGEDLLREIAKHYPGLRRVAMSADMTNWEAAVAYGIVTGVWDKSGEIGELLELLGGEATP